MLFSTRGIISTCTLSHICQFIDSQPSIEVLWFRMILVTPCLPRQDWHSYMLCWLVVYSSVVGPRIRQFRYNLVTVDIPLWRCSLEIFLRDFSQRTVQEISARILISALPDRVVELS